MWIFYIDYTNFLQSIKITPLSSQTKGTVFSGKIWQELELEPESEPEPKLWTKVEPEPESEPKINNFGSATLHIILIPLSSVPFWNDVKAGVHSCLQRIHWFPYMGISSGKSGDENEKPWPQSLYFEHYFCLYTILQFNSSFKANTVVVPYIPFKTLANIFWSLHCMTPLPSNFVTLYLKRTICTEEKAKVVASVWGGKTLFNSLPW